ncbi:MAG: hypothetical protein ACRD07_14080, partial [Acidimicrobiales bacterium]
SRRDDGAGADGSGDAARGGGDPGEFCSQAQAINERFANLGQLDADDANAAEDAFVEIADAVAAITPPEEIAADWQLYVSLYDLEGDAAAQIDQAELAEAGAKVEEYLRTECFTADGGEATPTTAGAG